ncbi:MAG: 16S rRNA (adenine(1518)-N(6)/adenine(1519)-N(6))-dimethyltransferase RsmA [Candidatus Bathyarchaeia archaeon]
MNRRKRLGQHFLIDLNVIEFIVETAELNRKDAVLEVGPGYGSLTRLLAVKSGLVIAVEKDPRLYHILSAKMDGFQNVRLIEGDVFKVALPNFNKVVSSLPYSVSTKFLKWLLRKDFESAILVLQREFAQKLVSQPGSKSYCKIMPLIRREMDVEVVKHVPSKAFKPPPRVDSCIVKITRKTHALNLDFQKFYEKMLNYLFSVKRKLAAPSVTRFALEIGLKGFHPPVGVKRVYELRVEELEQIANSLYRLRCRREIDLDE